MADPSQRKEVTLFLKVVMPMMSTYETVTLIIAFAMLVAVIINGQK